MCRRIGTDGSSSSWTSAYPDDADIFAVGDTITVPGPNGAPVPGIAPAAKQEGAFVAETIRRRLSGNSERRAFRYRHEGSLAQIGKGKAVIDFGWLKLRGAIAWWFWGHRPHLLPGRRPVPAQRRAQLVMDLRPRPTQRAADHASRRTGRMVD